MEQLAQVVWGLALVVTVLAVLAATAMAFGADSRPCIGDTHTAQRRGDWT